MTIELDTKIKTASIKSIVSIRGISIRIIFMYNISSIIFILIFTIISKIILYKICILSYEK